MRVIGYTYEADCHCITCTQARFASVPDDGQGTDEHDIAYCATDREGNLIHPIFSTDELQLDDEDRPMDCVCGTCGSVIVEA